MASTDRYRLDGKVALVTGAAAGIGLAIAEAFATRGAQLVLWDRSARVEESARRFAGALGDVVDVTSRDQIEAAHARALERFGRIDVLVNNAGIVALEPADRFSEENWRSTMAVNLDAVYRVSQVVGGGMLAAGEGRIVNLASQAGVVALEGHLAYCVSKAGVIALTKGLAMEWSPRGVRVNAVSPTVVMTELGRGVWSGPIGDQTKALLPMRRFAEPHEVADAVVFLACDAAAMITGENLMVDGGYTIV